jgi:hypothetical protein
MSGNPMEEHMPIFESPGQFSALLVELWETVLGNETTSELVRSSRMSVLTSFHEPELLFWVGSEGVFSGEEANRDAAIRLEMTANTAHDIYSKKVDLATALGTGVVRAKGPAMKLMQLGPLLLGVIDEYPGVCQRHGVLKQGKSSDGHESLT